MQLLTLLNAYDISGAVLTQSLSMTAVNITVQGRRGGKWMGRVMWQAQWKWPAFPGQLM